MKVYSIVPPVKKLCLFSRRTGWPNAAPRGFYKTHPLNLCDKKFIDVKAKNIIKLTSLDSHDYKICKIYPDWYLYPEDTIITNPDSL